MGLNSNLSFQDIELSELQTNGKKASEDGEYECPDSSKLSLTRPQEVHLQPDRKKDSDSDTLAEESIPAEYRGSIRSRKHLESCIVTEWKLVWLGLYETGDKTHRRHNDQLRALYSGAGLFNDSQAEIQSLNWDLEDYRFNSGVAKLKLFNNLSISMLKEVIDLLGDYKEEIRSMDYLYSILEKNQLGWCRVAEPNKATALQKEYIALREQMEGRIMGYNYRMNLLNERILAVGRISRPKDTYNYLNGKYVCQRAFPSVPWSFETYFKNIFREAL